MDADVDAFIRRLSNRAEEVLNHSEELQRNDYELDYLVEDLRDELNSVVIGLRSLLQ